MSLREIFIDELRDLYSAENQLIKSLPKTAKATNNAQLKQIFLTHLDETKQQAERLKQIFGMLGKKPTGKHCSGMEGAIDEVKEALEEEDEEGALYDTGIIGGATRVEHYEIAGYTCAIAMARQLGETEAVGLLTQTLNEEVNAGRAVLMVAKGILKEAYAMEPDEKQVPDKKPKDAKEKLSEEESENDEEDAEENMGMSAEDAMNDAADADDDPEEEAEEVEKTAKKAAATKKAAKKTAKKAVKKSTSKKK